MDYGNNGVKVTETTWVIARCYERRPDKRIRFAHTAPVHIEVGNKPIRPARAEVAYLIKRVQDQIQRSKSILKPDAMAEYQKALKIYQEIAKRAK